MAKFIRNNAGRLTETATLASSAGAGDADKVPSTNGSGVLDPSILNAATTGNNKVLLTDGSGRISSSVLPVGVGPQTYELEAFEALAAGDVVNVFSDSGTGKVRLADASNDRPANGFVLSAVIATGMATVYTEGFNSQSAGLTPGTLFLSNTVPGGVQGTAPTSGIVQIVGTALSATAFDFEAQPPITLV